jgi:hypothetical protein
MQCCQEQLSEVNRTFFQFVDHNPQAGHADSFRMMNLNDSLFKLQPWPTFINSESRSSFEKVSTSLFRLIRQIPQRMFANDAHKISRYFNIPLKQVQYCLKGVTEDSLQHLAARGDFVLSQSGLKCLEYNVSLSLGGWQIPIWESLCLNTPIISRFIKENQVKIANKNLFSLFLQHIIESIPPHIALPPQPLNIALIVKGMTQSTTSRTGIYMNQLYQTLLKQKWPGGSGQIVVCDYPDLHLQDKHLFFKDNKIHALAEMYHGEVPEHVYHAFQNQTLRLINGPIAQLLDNKLFLALLSTHQQQPIFTPVEQQIIANHVPWTRKVTEQNTHFYQEPVTHMGDFILANREKLVLKAAVGYGGNDVHIGSKTTPQLWQEITQKAIKEETWVVQELIAAIPGTYQVGHQGSEPHDISLGFFVFGDLYGGTWVRVMSQRSNKGVINCHQGATVSVVFDVQN